jgi:hypothetical protein
MATEMAEIHEVLGHYLLVILKENAFSLVIQNIFKHSAEHS